MQTGISTSCFYPRLTEESLRALTAMGVDCVEIFLNAACELRPDYLRELRAIADDAGVSVASVHPYASAMEPMYFFSLYNRRFDEGLEHYRRFFEAARILGAELVVFHGNTKYSRMSVEEYCERFARIRSLGRELGVELCQENVERCQANDRSFIQSMCRLLPDVGWILDLKQAVRAKQDVFELTEAMGKNLRHIHISDNDVFNSCMLPGRGSFDLARFLAELVRQDFAGSVILELYSQDFQTDVELQQGYQHIVDLLSTIKARCDRQKQ